MQAGPAGDEVVGFPHRQDDPEIQVHAVFLAFRAGDGLHQIGNVRLGPLVKLHVRMHREGVAALLAHRLAFAVRLQGPAVDHEGAGFADRAANAAQAGFDMFYRWTGHIGLLRKYSGLFFQSATGRSAFVRLRRDTRFTFSHQQGRVKSVAPAIATSL